MTDDLSFTGKGIQEIAKATDQSADAIAKVGSLMDRAFGNILSNSIGLVSDKLAYFRLERAVLLKDKVDKRLKAKGIDASRHVPVNFGLPLIEKATVEDNDTLHDKWANLLANAMDPTYVGKLERGFVDILGSLEARDAKIFDALVGSFGKVAEANKATAHFTKENVAEGTQNSIEDTAISLRNLFRLGLVRPAILKGGVKLGPEPITIYKDIDAVVPTELGLAFHDAVSE